MYVCLSVCLSDSPCTYCDRLKKVANVVSQRRGIALILLPLCRPREDTYRMMIDDVTQL